MEKYKNVVFDIGNVLLIWEPNYLIEKVFGHPYPEINDIIHSNIWKGLDKGTISKEEAVLMVPERIQKDFEKFLNNFYTHMTPIFEVVSLIEKFHKKGFKLYILSNFHKDAFEEIKNFEFFKFFDGKIISSHVNSIKPSKEIYESLFNTYNLDPKKSLFIDDKEENILQGEKMGMNGIICTGHKYLYQELGKLGFTDL